MSMKEIRNWWWLALLGEDLVREVLSRYWKLKKQFIMRPYGEKMFTFKFESEEDRSSVLEKGSLHIASQLVVIRPWKPFVETEGEELKTIPIWVLFKNFPMDLWDAKGFHMVGSSVGHPLFTDRLTEERQRTSYARICIEVDTNCKFPKETTIVLDQKKVVRIPIEYNWKPAKCMKCDVFGHNEKTCPKAKKVNQQNVWIQRGRREEAP
ncbi:Rna exonuclease [Thalictrum thalictroides]|uniref:Rna exonuclease n=1 Tax=Thalictrum thalictroides TaxID=46969 RepID=A0A7J6VR58_THATH|nr:Rna exonuclease [Thalictrum thalictroides]